MTKRTFTPEQIVANNRAHRSSPYCHMLPIGYRTTSTSVLGGFHPEYGLEKQAACWQIEFLLTTAPLPAIMEKRSHIVDPQLRLIECREVTATRHIRPALDIVSRLRGAAG
jgi:hypothetical protein